MEELEVVLEVYKWILWGGFDNNGLWESFFSIFGSFNVMTFRRRVKSPEVVETTFTMSTIEEEMEGVGVTIIAIIIIIAVIDIIILRNYH